MLRALPFSKQELFLRLMGSLSNFPLFRGLWAGSAPAAPVLRPALDPEVEPAVRLILSSWGGSPDAAMIREFVRIAREQSGPAGGLRVAEQKGRLISAVLPVASPGRTLLLFLPSSLRGNTARQATVELAEQCCVQARSGGIQLAQALPDPEDNWTMSVLQSAGFARLAELMYLQAMIPRHVQPPKLPAGFALAHYTAETHDLFARAIAASYVHSLDCPSLNGLREMEDVLAGHKGTGVFDPVHWFVLHEDGRPGGVLLLSRITRSDSFELVYLGIPPEQRGRGFGDLLMRQAWHSVSRSDCVRLTLAVDGSNEPALRLYFRHGMSAVGRKSAFLRDLRCGASE